MKRETWYLIIIIAVLFDPIKQVFLIRKDFAKGGVRHAYIDMVRNALTIERFCFDIANKFKVWAEKISKLIYRSIII